jgi:pyrroloquinoline quinone biosynthesis protein B
VDARAGRRRAEKVAAIGLRNARTGASNLIDATPDLPAQIHALTGGRAPDGIFLTHAHIGHYTGLMYLGKETMSARGVPVYGTARMAAFLRANGPWKLLVDDGHIALREIDTDRPVDLGGARVTAMRVPHRDELSDTVGYLVEGPRKKALYIPDVDRWEKWDRDIGAIADQVDLLLLDGTFASAAELPHRDIARVPHPLLSDTRARVRGRKARVLFIHLNHTNPALVDGTPDVAREGMTFPL